MVTILNFTIFILFDKIKYKVVMNKCKFQAPETFI